MTRRRLLYVAVLTVGGLVCRPRLRQHRSAAVRSRSFYIAGVRFHSSVKGLKPMDAVRLKLGSFQGAPSYEVLSESGARLGYVPKNEVPMFCDRQVLRSWLSAVQESAVPWKKYLVTALTEDESSG